MTDLLEVALHVAGILDSAGVRYSIGGSIASSISGEPRASIDVDFVVDLQPSHVPILVRALSPAFYVDENALLRAIASKSSANVIHHATGIKVDLFVAGSFLDSRQLARRRRVQIAGDPPRHVFVHTPEDILLQKLHWFRAGGETSERQWRDAKAIVAVQTSRMDRDYLAATAAATGLTDLLERVLAEGSISK